MLCFSLIPCFSAFISNLSNINFLFNEGCCTDLTFLNIYVPTFQSIFNIYISTFFVNFQRCCMFQHLDVAACFPEFRSLIPIIVSFLFLSLHFSSVSISAWLDCTLLLLLHDLLSKVSVLPLAWKLYLNNQNKPI